MIKLVCVYLAIAVLLGATAHGQQSQRDLLQLNDIVCETSCQVKTIREINEQIFPEIHRLMDTAFFKYFKVNLYKQCLFWRDDNMCMNRDCAVTEADEREIPEQWRSANLSRIASGSAGFGDAFDVLQKKCDEKDFCVVEPEHTNGGTYVNLVLNPERFTGYSGDSAQRVWSSIYNENCFDVSSLARESGDLLGSLDGVCAEKRVFYRLLSGLHSSISMHICSEFMNQKTGHWYSNLSCYVYRLGMHPERLKNLYFVYTVVLTALHKWSRYMETFDYFSGNSTEDVFIKRAMSNVFTTIRSYPKPFDEALFFRDASSEQYFDGTGSAGSAKHTEIAGSKLLEEFKLKFRNITTIMDCVSCEKCRLWGKIQTQGLGTAMKMLFSFQEIDAAHYKLNRAELLTLFNLFHRLSESLLEAQRFDKMWSEQMEREHFAKSDTDGPEHLHMVRQPEADKDSAPVVVVPSITNLPEMQSKYASASPQMTVEIEVESATSTYQPSTTVFREAPQQEQLVLSSSHSEPALPVTSSVSFPVPTEATFTFASSQEKPVTRVAVPLNETASASTAEVLVTTEISSTAIAVKDVPTTEAPSPTVRAVLDTPAATEEPVRSAFKMPDPPKVVPVKESTASPNISHERDWIELAWHYAEISGDMCKRFAGFVADKVQQYYRRYSPHVHLTLGQHGSELYAIFKSQAALKAALDKSPTTVLQYGLGAAFSLIVCFLFALLLLSQLFSFVHNFLYIFCCGFCCFKCCRKTSKSKSVQDTFPPSMQPQQSGSTANLSEMPRVPQPWAAASRTNGSPSNSLSVSSSEATGETLLRNRKTAASGPAIPMPPTLSHEPVTARKSSISDRDVSQKPAMSFEQNVAQSVSYNSSLVSSVSGSVAVDSDKKERNKSLEETASSNEAIAAHDTGHSQTSTLPVSKQNSFAAAPVRPLPSMSSTGQFAQMQGIPSKPQVSRSESFGKFPVDGTSTLPLKAGSIPVSNFAAPPFNSSSSTAAAFGSSQPQFAGQTPRSGPPPSASYSTQKLPSGIQSGVCSPQASEYDLNPAQQRQGSSHLVQRPIPAGGPPVPAPAAASEQKYASQSSEAFPKAAARFSQQSSAQNSSVGLFNDEQAFVNRPNSEFFAQPYSQQTSPQKPSAPLSGTEQPFINQQASKVNPSHGFSSNAPASRQNLASFSTSQNQVFGDDGSDFVKQSDFVRQSDVARQSDFGPQPAIIAANRDSLSARQSAEQSQRPPLPVQGQSQYVNKPPFGVSVVSSVFEGDSGVFGAKSTAANPWGNLIRRASAKASGGANAESRPKGQQSATGSTEVPANPNAFDEFFESHQPVLRGPVGSELAEASSLIAGSDTGSLRPNRPSMFLSSGSAVSAASSRRTSAYGVVSPNSFGLSYHTNPNHGPMGKSHSGTALIGPANLDPSSGMTSPTSADSERAKRNSGDGKVTDGKPIKRPPQYLQGANFESTDSLTSFQV